MNVQECDHSVTLGTLCALCGREIDFRLNQQDTVPYVYQRPELRMTKQEAHSLRDADRSRLLNSQKLILVLDLDHTLVHSSSSTHGMTTETSQDIEIIKFSRMPTYYVKLRPHAIEFLNKLSSNYELHVCSMGDRNYVNSVCKILDPEGRLFEKRILSRDEFLLESKKGIFDKLFPCGWEMICVVDDRVDTWEFSPSVIRVKPFVYFKGEGNPPYDESANSKNYLPSLAGVLEEIHYEFYKDGEHSDLRVIVPNVLGRHRRLRFQ